MRKPNPADSLFSRVKQDILAATYGQPDRWWYLSELASYAGKTPSTLQRELKTLAASGVLRTKRDNSRLYFQAETNSPFFQPLRLLIEQTLGVVEALRSAMEPLSDRVDVAFVYGSTARGEQTSRSDVDVIVIGVVGLADLTKILRPLEAKFRREFDARCYEGAEFRHKLEKGNHFVTSIMKEQKLFVVGDEHDLERITKQR